MPELQIPDFMPVLAAGSHKDPSLGACIMEYVSMLAGEKFSDRPSCTNPWLGSLARNVNDALIDAHRSLLVPLICRLVNTTGLDCGKSGAVVSANFENFVDQQIDLQLDLRDVYRGLNARTTPTWSQDCSRGLLGRATEQQHEEQRQAQMGRFAQHMVGGLVRCLDKYDELTGRTEFYELTEADKNLLLAAVGTNS